MQYWNLRDSPSFTFLLPSVFTFILVLGHNHVISQQSCNQGIICSISKARNHLEKHYSLSAESDSRKKMSKGCRRDWTFNHATNFSDFTMYYSLFIILEYKVSEKQVKSESIIKQEGMIMLTNIPFSAAKKEK